MATFSSVIDMFDATMDDLLMRGIKGLVDLPSTYSCRYVCGQKLENLVLIMDSRWAFVMTVARRLRSFIVGLTGHDPRKHDGPLHSSYQTCGGHNGTMTLGKVVNLACAVPLYAWGRYLFVAAKAAHGFFHLAEVEMYDGMLA